MHFFARHRGERKFNAALHRVEATSRCVSSTMIAPSRADHLNPCGREIRISRRKHPARPNRKHAAIIERHDDPRAIRHAVRRIHDLVHQLRVNAHRFSRLKAPQHKINIVRRFHCGGRKLDAPADFISQVARDVPAHKRARRFADCAVVDRPFYIREFRIEPLRIPDGEEQRFRPRKVNQFVRFSQRPTKSAFPTASVFPRVAFPWPLDSARFPAWPKR